MFGFLRRKKPVPPTPEPGTSASSPVGTVAIEPASNALRSSEPSKPPAPSQPSAPSQPPAPTEQSEPSRTGWIKRLRAGLSRTSGQLASCPLVRLSPARRRLIHPVRDGSDCSVGAGGCEGAEGCEGAGGLDGSDDRSAFDAGSIATVPTGLEADVPGSGVGGTGFLRRRKPNIGRLV